MFWSVLMDNKAFKNAKEWISVLSLFTVVSCLIIQPFKIPSGSMIPTFLVGDFLLVNKFCYGYSNDSFRIGTFTFPLPNIKERILASGLPQQGDVVVFRNEKDKNQNYIKRIIGLPGDTIQLIDGVVNLNGKPVELKSDGEYSMIDDGDYIVYKKYIEKLPNGYEHVIIKRVEFGEGYLDNVGPFVIPEGHYFMMGDNRDNSQDSRVMETVGFIPIDRIMGKAFCIFFSTSCSLSEILKWLISIRVERIFTLVR
ncbi:MAG: signal peptidase I [Holosporales bacterium]|nr:signal peptidase I [Holosporales bacterium]